MYSSVTTSRRRLGQIDRVIVDRDGYRVIEKQAHAAWQFGRERVKVVLRAVNFASWHCGTAAVPQVALTVPTRFRPAIVLPARVL